MLRRRLTHVVTTVSLAEWVLGTHRTAAIFWTGHPVVSALVEFIHRIAVHGDWDLAERLGGDSFGPSAGGCVLIGAAILRCRTALRIAILLVLFTGFPAKVLLHPEPAADLTHAIGFILGLAATPLLGPRSVDAAARIESDR